MRHPVLVFIERQEVFLIDLKLLPGDVRFYLVTGSRCRFEGTDEISGCLEIGRTLAVWRLQGLPWCGQVHQLQFITSIGD